jgi:hypothetical protein
LVWLLVNAARILGSRASAETWNIDLLASMSLAFAGLSLSHARKMAELLTVGRDRTVLWFYPLPGKDFFRWAVLRFVARSTWIALVAAIVYFLASQSLEAPGWAVLLGAPLAEWLIVLCIAVAMVQHVGMLPSWLPLGLYVAAGLVLFVPAPYGHAVSPLASALPTGWLHLLITNARAKEWSGSAALCATLALGVLCWQLLRRLETIYCRGEAPLEERPPMNEEPTTEEHAQDAMDRFATEQARSDEEETDEMAMEFAGEAVLPIQAVWQKQRFENWGSEAGEVVRQGNWLNGWNWSGMLPIERVAGWCLNAREKAEAQFLLGPRMPSWSNRWRTSAIATAVGVATVAAGIWEFNMVSALAFAVSAGSGVPLLGGEWPATNQGRISGKFSPIYGCYPLSYWTAGWIMFKVNAVRTAAWLPLGLMIGVLNAKIAHTTVVDSCWLVARAVLLFLGLMPILLAGKFSKVTNDTLNLRLRTIPVLGLFLIVIFAVVSFGAGVVMASGWWPMAFLAGVAVVSWAAWAGYGWYYDHGQADLLREQA